MRRLVNNLTVSEAAGILRRHNLWLRGDEDEMTHPKILRQAIDVMIAAINANENLGKEEFTKWWNEQMGFGIRAEWAGTPEEGAWMAWEYLSSMINSQN